MAEDRWKNRQGDLESPATNAADVTPSDSTNLDPPAKALYVGTTGDVSVEMFGTGTALVFHNVPVGILPIRVSRVNSTSTTASDIIALW